MISRLLFLGPFLALCFLIGCGPSEPQKHEVTGTITWNGAPLPQGDILFEAVDGQTAPDPGKIVAGAFKLRATAGKKIVRISATRETEIDPVMKSSQREQYIPVRYNSESNLEKEVKAGANRFDFKLTEEQ